MTPPRWRVVRYAFNEPHHVAPPADLEDALQASVLEFAAEPRTWTEIEQHLATVCDCPPELLEALAIYLCSRLYAGDHKGPDGRWLTMLPYLRGQPSRKQTTPRGQEHLAELKEKGVTAR